MELEQPQHEGICLGAKSDPTCPHMLSMHKPAYPTCVTVEVNVLPFPVIIPADLLSKGPIQPIYSVNW